ncbi:MAG: integrase [Pseudooceanicola sp.]|nr:integrase [Pseudooceanicola sp.]|tara:strand:+ start:8230 stop:9213 length:984 start_codon:yes stop_codon:yes gene_type:complete
MSPKRSKSNKWPHRVTFKNGAFYYLKPIIKAGKTTTKWLRLGKTEREMYQRLAELKSDGTGLMSAIIQRYREEVLSKKADNTQNSQGKQLDRLNQAFGHMRPADIRTVHIARYHDLVGQSGIYQANRELSLVKHVLKLAQRWGYIDHNPASDVSRFTEKPRDRYITDDEYVAVRSMARVWIQVIMDICYVTGQRRVDILNLKRSDLRDDGVHIRQSKTGKRLVLEWSNDLRFALSRALTELHTGEVSSLYVICDDKGQRRTDAAFTTAWTRLMNQCIEAGVIGDKFQFRDIRGKAGSESDGKQLGHQSSATLERHYKRLPERVKPTV